VPAVHEQELKKIWQSGGAGREALRKVLRDETSSYIVRGILSGGYVKNGEIVRSYPYVLVDVFQALERVDLENRVFVSDVGGYVVSEVDLEEESIVWNFGNFRDTPETSPIQPLGIDYSPDKGRVLISDRRNHRILEVSYPSKEIVTEIKNYKGVGSIGLIWGLHYDKLDENYAFFADWSYHIAGRIDLRDGSLDWSWGVYNTPGSALDRLNRPKDVSFLWGRYCIADFSNQRVLSINPETNSVEGLLLISGPNSVRGANLKSRGALFGGISSGDVKGQTYTILLTDFNLTGAVNYCGVPLALASFSSNIVSPTQNNPLKLWFTMANSALLIDLSRGNILFPTHRTIWENQAVSAGSEVTSPPLITLGYRLFMVEIHSTQDCTVYIERPVPSYNQIWVPTDYSWEEFDHFSVSAGSLVPWATTTPPNILRIRVVMGSSDGVINGTYRLEP